MNYKEMYKIGQSLIQSFLNGKKIKNVKGVSSKFEKVVPVYRYEDFSVKYFTLYSIFLIQKYAITTFSEFAKRLREPEINEFKKWKNDIIMYKDYMKQDLGYLTKKYGILDERTISDYLEGKIKIFTLACILKNTGRIEKLKEKRAYNLLLKKIIFFNLFIKIDCMCEKSLINF